MKEHWSTFLFETGLVLLIAGVGAIVFAFIAEGDRSHSLFIGLGGLAGVIISVCVFVWAYRLDSPK